MQFKIKCPEDFWAGVMFITFGVIAIVVSQDYPMGTAMRMGPGYFPTYLGAILVVLGAIISAFSFTMEGESIKPFAWKPMIMLSLSFVVFGWGIDHIGFVPSLFGLIVFSAAAGRQFKLGEVLILSVVLIVGAVGIFIYGIDLPYPLFWWR
ncbi:MAG: tripartite tricarboxylate transporter TctB family protein [Burkholderiales bacterium]|nr:tripartite tricarboxylate transporter TctB family protein [Burkholderiales bacterium]